MKKILLALLLLAPGLAHADSITSRFGLIIPSTGTAGWGVKLNADFNIIASSAGSQYEANTWVASNTFTGAVAFVDGVVARSTLTVQGNAFSVGTSTLAVVSGKLGVGTSAPAEFSGGVRRVIHLVDTTNEALYRVRGSAVDMEMGVNSTIGFLSVRTNHPYTISTNNAERVRVSTGGLVGIATTAPGTALDVVGTVRGSTLTSTVNITGPAQGITGYAVTASSESTNSIAVNSTAFITVTTMTVTLRGSRPVQGSAIVSIVNGAGATRNYTVEVQKGGVAVSLDYVSMVTGGDTSSLAAIWSEASSSAGSQTYTILVKSSSATGTQTATSRHLRLVEY